MAKKSSEPLSPAEWKIMKVVWEKKSCAARDICAEVCEPNHWTPSTVKTMLARLVDKGYLNTTPVGNSYLYTAAKPAMKSLLYAADTLVENFLSGTSGPVLSHMIKKSKLTAKDIQDLRNILDAFEENES